jgi:hypothetical protein
VHLLVVERTMLNQREWRRDWYQASMHSKIALARWWAGQDFWSSN